VIPLIEKSRSQLMEIATRFGVRQLELFGSGVCGTFDVDRSDLDFLVEFKVIAALDAADQYFGLLFALQKLFGRNIDLLDATVQTNPYFLRAIAGSRTVIYAP
jgi:uncharacterized protein